VGVYIIVIAALVVTNIACLVFLLEIKRHPAKKSQSPSAEAVLPAQLSPERIAQIEATTQAAFEAAVQRASQRFDQDLGTTSEKLNQLIVRLTTDVVEKELTDYRQGLADARAAALESLRQMQATVNQQQATLETDMKAEMDKRKAYLVERLDRRLGEIATSYIIESLGQGVDLGAQKTFLMDSLERNKEALKKDILGDV
jgi:flagellar biosynthesis/type III secretory pathway protein FliH